VVLMDRLTRGLAAIDREVNHGDGTICSDLSIHDERAERRAATTTGKALAALVEAAEAWHDIDYGHPREFVADAELNDAIIAWLVATEEAPDAR